LPDEYDSPEKIGPKLMMRTVKFSRKHQTVIKHALSKNSFVMDLNDVKAKSAHWNWPGELAARVPQVFLDTLADFGSFEDEPTNHTNFNLPLFISLNVNELAILLSD